MDRISGLGSSGLDIDSLVKSGMKSYNIKVDVAKQQKETLEIKQNQYRSILKEAQDFHKKYLSLTSSDSLLQSNNFADVKFDSSDSSAVKVTGLAGAKVENYNVKVAQIASAATVTITNVNDVVGQAKITINGTDVSLAGVTDLNGVAKAINDAKISGVTASNSQFAKGLVIKTTSMGAAQTLMVKNNAGTNIGTNVPGKDASVEITKISDGTKYTLSGSEVTKNSIILDGVQFEFNNTTTALPNGVATITGAKDVTVAKDKIVKFINEYNTVIEKLNTSVNTNHNKNYSPLTSDQKKDMSESDIKLWNEKVKEGQLYRDSDITRIANNMKTAMRSMVGDLGITLESIGIKPVKDNGGNKNGTFTIDETVLTKALEGKSTDAKLSSALQKNPNAIMDMFNSTPDSTAVTDQQKYNQSGLVRRLKSIFDDEVYGDSAIIKKAGMEGTRFVIDNTLSKSISQFETKISKMEKDLTKREQSLYTKYTNLQTILEKYSSQQTSLASMLSGN